MAIGHSSLLPSSQWVGLNDPDSQEDFPSSRHSDREKEREKEVRLIAAKLGLNDSSGPSPVEFSIPEATKWLPSCRQTFLHSPTLDYQSTPFGACSAAAEGWGLLGLVFLHHSFNFSEGSINQITQDNCAILAKHRRLNGAVERTNEALRGISDWGNTWGCKFSHAKTKGMIFTKGKSGEEWTLYLYVEKIQAVQIFTFLGVVFDNKLTWKGHTDNIKTKGKNRMNLL